MNPARKKILAEDRLSDMTKLAIMHGWDQLDYQENIYMVSFRRNGVRLNIYLTTLTISASMDHPSKGKTQLFRKRLSNKEIGGVFVNPRIHTGKGYYKK